MNELHEKLLKMLEYFHELCKRENLRYYALGGTALGAARHGGFIPWDDDIDVGMPREDYNKLIALTSKNTDKYQFEFFADSKEYIYMFGKMYDTSTTLIENTRYQAKRGIYLDIFPLDGVGDDYEKAIKKVKLVRKKMEHWYWPHVCAKKKDRSFVKKAVIFAIRCAPDFILSQRKAGKKIEKICTQASFDDNKYIANFFGAWGVREITEKKHFGQPVERDFECQKIMCPEYIDEYLTGLYGDWRTPPPPEKQISHHDYLVLDLNKSYLED